MLSDYNIQKESLSISFFVCVVECKFSCQAPAHFRITTFKRSLHLVLRLRSGMQIFVKHQHTFGLQHPKGVTTLFFVCVGEDPLLLHLVLHLHCGMQIFVKHQHTFGLQHPKGVTTLFFICIREDPLLLPYFSTSFFICVVECRFLCQAPACMALSLPYCTCHCMPCKIFD